MPHNIPGNSSTFHPVIRAPSDGDDDAESAFDPAFGDLADNCVYLKRCMLNAVEGGIYQLDPGAGLAMGNGPGNSGLNLSDAGLGIDGFVSIGGAAMPTTGGGGHATNIAGATQITNGGTLHWLTGTNAHFESGSGLVMEGSSSLQVLLGAALNVAGSLTLTGSGTFGGTSSSTYLANSTVEAQSDSHWTFDAGSKLTLNATVDGTQHITGVLSFEGPGRMRKRVLIGDATPRSYSVFQADLIRVPVLTADVDYQITAVGATNGENIKVSLRGASTLHTVTLRDDAGNIIITLRNAATGYASVTLILQGGAWVEEDMCSAAAA